ncbi:hypothetical protein WJX72_011857 [[Myrmecia] bisecta]|uniref:Amino acid transporter transmembrane domain-containing protein n=1 Tax=[Myrmecia] bisecta TaxID=41462 RepID=A0AAW1QTZ5_9CHLO
MTPVTGADDSAHNLHTAEEGKLGKDEYASPLHRDSLSRVFVQREGEEYDDDGHVKRTGTSLTASAHIITAVIGSGVLSLAWASAQIGWVAAPIGLAMFALITYYCSRMLADAYRFPTPMGPERHYSYMDAVRSYLSPWQVVACGVVQYVNMVGTGVGYTVTAGISAVAIRRSDCFHADTTGTAVCAISNNPWMLAYGGMQILLSQVPDFDRLWWLSIIAAAMSFGYSSIGVGLAIGKATQHDHSHGTLGGVQIGVDTSSWGKTWLVFQSLGNIAFAYSFSLILIEIQDTLKPDKGQPRTEHKVMKRATLAGIVVTTTFYACAGLIGYAGFGDSAPGNLLTGFGFFNPYWLVNLANTMVFVHLVGAYQVYTQPFFGFVESRVLRAFPKNHFVTHEYAFHVPFLGILNFNMFRLVWRTLYVCFTTVVAMLLPFFNDILGFLGALGFWPLTVYFPVQMHIAQKKVRRFSPYWIWLQSLSFFCFLISLAAAAGSIEGVVQDTKSYTPFHTNY